MESSRLISMNSEGPWNIRPGSIGYTQEGEPVQVLGYETRITENVIALGLRVIGIGMEEPTWVPIHSVVDEMTLIQEVKARTDKQQKKAEKFLRKHDQEMRKIDSVLTRLQNQDNIIEQIYAMGYEADEWRKVEGDRN